MNKSQLAFGAASKVTYLEVMGWSQDIVNKR